MNRGFVLLVVSFLIVLPLNAQLISVTDVGRTTGFQDTTLGHFQRGRACLAADFDLDGYVDFYMGNPGDESYVLHSVSDGSSGARRFETLPLPLSDELTWGAVSFDFDNDGDYDIFVSVGGSEGVGLNYLFRNEWMESGILEFSDVSESAGIRGIVPDGETEPVASASANAVTADYDRDGDVDLFVNGNIKPIPEFPELVGRNTLWRNNGDGTFTDVTMDAGLGDYRHATRHSTFFDFDNDGYPDLYENNYFGCNVLWKNNGDGTFADVTTGMSPPGEDLSDPVSSFASGTADFNNDGWEDLIVFMRGEGADGEVMGTCDCSVCDNQIPVDNVDCDGVDAYEPGHALFINLGGTGFSNVAQLSGLNDDFVGTNGVMGCQVGDLNGDGTPDVYVGNGGPPNGEPDRLYISTNVPGAPVPSYSNQTALIDFPAEVGGGIPPPPYPYRTHGIAFVDVDNNGTVEIAVSNGGPAEMADSVREPDRLFAIETTEPFTYVKVRPVGNGMNVSMDAVGTRVKVTVMNAIGERWTVFRTLVAGSAFSAQNGFELFIGLRDASAIESIEILWPDGVNTVLTDGLALNSRIVVYYDGTVTGSEDPVHKPETFRVEQNYPNPFNPTTAIEYSLGRSDHVTLKIYSSVGEEVVTLVDEFQEAGQKVVSWDGRDAQGTQLASGMYVYRIRTSSAVEVRKLLLVK